MTRIFLTLLVILSVYTVYSQPVSDGIGIGTSSVDPSAVLEIHSSTDTKGLLIPRVTNRLKVDVSHKPKGLTVYDTSDNGYYYYDGSRWLRLASEDMRNHRIGNLSNGSASKDAVNKGQMDGADSKRLAKTGGTMTGPINMSGKKLTNVGKGTANGDAVNVEQLKLLQNQINTLSNNLTTLSNQLGFLWVGNKKIGDIDGDSQYNFTFPSVGTDNYFVLVSVESEGIYGYDDNDFSYVVLGKTPTSFKLYFREHRKIRQELRVRYMLLRNNTRSR
ncbi:hypothetical protein [Reichenbachiella versicolor]|uniref:hypothetical protein n=1 Tax=Reichenbachiella versicolor TaxID=1821036 RepID=UPI000D6DE152|nr:hypothetical protein [Reichenbachiella versicolor]